MPGPTQSRRTVSGRDRGRVIALPRRPDWPRQHNVPAAVSSFVGRESELAEVMRLLRDHRLVTLTGPGGAGKTRLALVVAAELIDGFDDGPWIVELAPLSHPSLVPQSLASTLGIREQPGRRLVATLSDVLQNRDLLLVLDNCEHLVDSCASLGETLLQVCPRAAHPRYEPGSVGADRGDHVARAATQLSGAPAPARPGETG